MVKLYFQKHATIQTLFLEMDALQLVKQKQDGLVLDLELVHAIQYVGIVWLKESKHVMMEIQCLETAVLPLANKK